MDPLDALPHFSPLEMALHRRLMVELLAELAATKPQPRQWLASFAGFLSRAAAETQHEAPAEGRSDALEVRTIIREVFDDAVNRLEQLLQSPGDPR